MNAKNERPQKIPRFSLVAGIGAIAVYLFGSIPFVVAVTVVKTAELSMKTPELTASEQSKVLTEYLTSSSVLVGTLVCQCISLFIYVWIVSVVRGTSNPFRDVGLRFTKFSPFYFLVGMVLQIAVGFFTLPIRLVAQKDEQQSVVNAVKDSRGLFFILMLVMVAIVVPIAEEVAFRGMFMRGMLRAGSRGHSHEPARWIISPAVAVVISGALFGLVHLLDISALQAIPALVLVGVIFSAFAMYRGRLDAAIFMHMGFNFVTVLYLAFTR